MNTLPTTTSDTLNRHLCHHTDANIPSIMRYIDRGGALVTPEAIASLQGQREALRAKIESCRNFGLLCRHLELLSLFFDETLTDGQTGTTAQRDAAFALLYFLKDQDRIPDFTPEIGLLDDAMIAQLVLMRHATALRAHWLRRRRPWPAELAV